MKTMKMTLCGIAVKGLASASVARPIKKVTMKAIKQIPAMATATAKTNNIVGFGVSVASGLVGDVIVDKLIDGACGNEKSHNTKHHKNNKKHYHKNEKDTKKKRLEVKGLPKKKEVKKGASA